MREPIDRLARALGYRFQDHRLLETALTHRSAGESNNERLEFLGDAILSWVIAAEVYHRHPGVGEGRLTRMRSSLVRGETLAEIAATLDLGSYMALGQGEMRSGGQSRASILADALEALIGAVYLDGGVDAARELILRLLGDRLEHLTPAAQGKDPKSRLQEYLQGRGLALPVYQVVSVEGEPHDQTFWVECTLPGLHRSAGATGGSRRKAEQAAAAALLEAIEGERG